MIGAKSVTKIVKIILKLRLKTKATVLKFTCPGQRAIKKVQAIKHFGF